VSNNCFRAVVVLIAFASAGCVGPQSNIASTADTGINVDYLFGSRRTTSQVINPTTSDAEYSDYRQWKLWQDFLAYQEWRRLNQ